MIDAGILAAAVLDRCCLDCGWPIGDGLGERCALCAIDALGGGEGQEADAEEDEQ